MVNLVLPRVPAMVLCDEINESDEDSEAIDLIGVRAVVTSAVFPTIISQICVFIQMSGHKGESQCHIEIESMVADEVIHETESLSFTFENPTTVVPAHFRVVNCVFLAPGLYYVQVYSGSKLIGERPLLLRQEK
jgi:hypothetical protein